MTHETKYYEVRGLNLAYHEWGERNSHVVLFFHGFLDHGLSFAPVAEKLADSLRVIAPDARGHGHSDWIGAGGYYHFADYFHDISVLVETLNVEHIHLVGHSMGGSVASGIAAMFGERIRTTVMLEGMGPPDEAFGDLPERLKRWHLAQNRSRNATDRETRKRSRKPMANVSEAAEKLRSLNKRLSRERALGFASSFTEVQDEGDGQQVVWRYDPLHRTIGARPFRFDEAQHLWRGITSPVLSLWGQDSVFRPEKIQRRHACLRDVRVALVRDAGHNIHHDQPEVVTDLIRDWVAGDRDNLLSDGATECDLALGL